MAMMSTNKRVSVLEVVHDDLYPNTPLLCFLGLFTLCSFCGTLYIAIIYTFDSGNIDYSLAFRNLKRFSYTMEHGARAPCLWEVFDNLAIIYY